MNLKFASIAGFCVAVLALMLLIMRDSILGVGFVAIIVQVLSGPAYALGTLYIRSSQFSCNSESHRRWSNNLWPISLSSTSYLCRCDIFSLGRNIKSCIIVECTLGVTATIGLFIRIYAEERLVTELYPSYAEYAVRTKRIIPYVY